MIERKVILKEFREAFPNFGSYGSYSDKRKGSQRVKFWALKTPKDKRPEDKDVEAYVAWFKNKGLEAKIHDNGRNIPSLVIHFPYSEYS